MPRSLLVLPAAILMAAGVLAAGQGVDPLTLPESEGKALLTKACADCHDLGTVLAKRMTPKQWQDVTDDMISRGVQADESDIKTLVLYLSKHASHVNINRATAADLKTALELTDGQAAAVIAARSAGTTFKTLDDVKKVPGLDAAALDERKERIVFADR